MAARGVTPQRLPAPPQAAAAPGATPGLRPSPLAAPKSESLTLEYLVKARLKLESNGAPRQVAWGRLADEWSRRQPDRREALRTLEAALKTQGIRGQVRDYIAAYWAAKLFGADPAAPPNFSVLRAVARLLKFDADTNEWAIREKTRTAAIAMFSQIVAHGMNAREAKDAVTGLRPKRKVRAKVRSAVGRIKREVQRLQVVTDLDEIIETALSRKHELTASGTDEAAKAA